MSQITIQEEVCQQLTEEQIDELMWLEWQEKIEAEQECTIEWYQMICQ